MELEWKQRNEAATVAAEAAEATAAAALYLNIGLEIENHKLNTQNEKRLNCCPIWFLSFSIEINRMCVLLIYE